MTLLSIELRIRHGKIHFYEVTFQLSPTLVALSQEGLSKPRNATALYAGLEPFDDEKRKCVRLNVASHDKNANALIL